MKELQLNQQKKRFAKRNVVGFIAGVATFFGMFLSGSSCVPIPPPNTDTQKPVVQVGNYETDEGLEGKIEFYASDNKGIKEVCVYIPGYDTEVSGEEPNFSAKYSPLDPNDKGKKGITVGAMDVNGNYAEATAEFYVNDTPDVEFYDMPDSASMQNGESKTSITGQMHYT